MRRTFEAVTCDFAVSFVRGVERRRFVLLGIQLLRPGDVVAVFFAVCYLTGVLCVKERALIFDVADIVCVCTAWRRLHDSAKHTRGCCWFEQRRSHGSFGLCKIACACCAADACVRAATVCLTDWVVVTWRLDIG